MSICLNLSSETLAKAVRKISTAMEGKEPFLVLEVGEQNGKYLMSLRADGEMQVFTEMVVEATQKGVIQCMLPQLFVTAVSTVSKQGDNICLEFGDTQVVIKCGNATIPVPYKTGDIPVASAMDNRIGAVQLDVAETKEALAVVKTFIVPAKAGSGSWVNCVGFRFTNSAVTLVGSCSIGFSRKTISARNTQVPENLPALAIPVIPITRAFGMIEGEKVNIYVTGNDNTPRKVVLVDASKTMFFIPLLRMAYAPVDELVTTLQPNSRFGGIVNTADFNKAVEVARLGDDKKIFLEIVENKLRVGNENGTTFVDVDMEYLGNMQRSAYFPATVVSAVSSFRSKKVYFQSNATGSGKPHEDKILFMSPVSDEDDSISDNAVAVYLPITSASKAEVQANDRKVQLEAEKAEKEREEQTENA